jgi:hypothetical protein
MQALAFLRTVTMDQTRFLEDLLRHLEASHTSYCVIGGQGVNAYADPLVSLDLDLVIVAAEMEAFLARLPDHVTVERFPHSITLSAAGSDLRVQLQVDARYEPFPSRATVRTVLGLPMRVGAVEDVLAGKVWAAGDPTRRASKRQKDLADIARLLEGFPALRDRVPANIQQRLLS